MSSTEGQSADIKRLNLLAEMSGSHEISLDAEEWEEILGQQEEVRREIGEVEQDLKILFAA